MHTIINRKNMNNLLFPDSETSPKHINAKIMFVIKFERFIITVLYIFCSCQVNMGSISDPPIGLSHSNTIGLNFIITILLK